MVIAVSLGSICYGQMLPRHVYCSGGGNFESLAIKASWTIGQAEPVATSYQSSIILCSGFQQYVETTVSIADHAQNNSCSVFPNPCNDYAMLLFESKNMVSLSYKLYDFSGKLLQSERIPGRSNDFRETIQMNGMPKGIYNLIVEIGSEKNKERKLIRLIKN